MDSQINADDKIFSQTCRNNNLCNDSSFRYVCYHPLYLLFAITLSDLMSL